MGWKAVDDPLAGHVDAGLLGGILQGQARIGALVHLHVKVNHTARFTIEGIKPTHYDRGMKLVHNHMVCGWKIAWAESKK